MVAFLATFFLAAFLAAFFLATVRPSVSKVTGRSLFRTVDVATRRHHPWVTSGSCRECRSCFLSSSPRFESFDSLLRATSVVTRSFAATCFLLLIAASRVFFSSLANALEIPKSNSVSLRINSFFRTIMPLAKRSSRAFLPTFYRNVKNFSSVASRSIGYFFSARACALPNDSVARRTALYCALHRIVVFTRDRTQHAALAHSMFARRAMPSSRCVA